MIYFNKPKKIYWDLISIKTGYKAKIFYSDSPIWQFSNSASVDILSVNKDKRLVTFDFSKRYDDVGIHDCYIIPNSAYVVHTETSNIVTLPFEYLANVSE